MALQLPRDGPLDTLALASFELDERDVEARTSVALSAVDPVRDRLLARPQAFADLPRSRGGARSSRLQRVERLRDGRDGRLLELLAQPEHSLALLRRARAELSRLRLDPRLDVGNRLPQLLLEPGGLRLEVLLIAVDVVGERASRSSTRRSIAASSVCNRIANAARHALRANSRCIREPSLLLLEQ